MKINRKKLFVITPVLLCVVLLICAGIGYIVYLRWCENTYNSEIFGCSYRINFNAYNQLHHINGMYSSAPVYFLSDNGKLHYATRDEDGYKDEVLTGHMKKIELTAQNFDKRLNEKNWVLSNISILGVRENNKETWYYQGKDGSTYYFLLQKNENVFLCEGYNGGISKILWLDQVGDRERFYDYIDNMNEMFVR